MMKKTVFTFILVCLAAFTQAEDGHRLWLPADGTAAQKAQVESSSRRPSATLRLAMQELEEHWKGGAVRILTGNKADRALGEDGYILQTGADGSVTVRALTDTGALYGAYHLLRLQATGQCENSLQLTEKPTYERRILNHWDNLDGSVERGYAGHSIFWRDGEATAPTVTEADRKLWQEYARANASIGINGVVLNNVNAAPRILSDIFLDKVQAIADVFRPYGIRVYLSVNFASPSAEGGLPTSDPLDKEVVKWWKNRVRAIYTRIPDFGGLLVKASSEGQPGPQDFGRTHADGANMLADALKPYKGIVMWRAFVYSAGDRDRAKQAYLEFMPFDGQFRDNVIIQVKNGPIDFQPREPFSPLFGAMKKTALMPELQITQEYLGHSFQLVYLGTMWEEFLRSDTFQEGEGSTVLRCTDGSLFPQPYTAIAGVANVGLDRNWCGHPFAPSNWYAFGRLAWNGSLGSREIAREWILQTFGSEALSPILKIMMESREAAVDYMMPLGLHHLFAWSHHYGPEPWCAPEGARPDWLPSYYHKADAVGVGFDRTRTGSDAVSQYHEPLASTFNNLETCPETCLLWFHHVPWDHRLKNGRTLWENLCLRYDAGVKKAREFQTLWEQAAPYVDDARFRDVQSRLRRQTRDAQWWKDACILYFQEFSHAPIPADVECPVNDLEDLKKIRLNWGHHN